MENCKVRDLNAALRKLISSPSDLKTKKETREKPDARPWHDSSYFARQTEIEDEHFCKTLTYLNRAGVDVNGLRVVHVAGTKGKGSTCSFVESILRHHGLKTGLFTSPHLIDVRERVRVSGVPVDMETFREHFWMVFDCFSSDERPGYFAFLFIVALSIFAAKQVDVVVLEVGLGGRLDATNVIRRPIVCGITQLDLDHTAILGSTLTCIANEKAGILKERVPAFTVSTQVPESAKALHTAAKRRSTSIVDVQPVSADTVLGLAGEHQRENAALAVALATEFLTATQRQVDSVALSRGLERCLCPGRAQIHVQNNISFYVDGAHTPKSIACCISWFLEQSKQTGKTYLVFNCAHTRNARQLFRSIVPHFDAFDGVLFCRSYSRPCADAVPTAKNAMGYSCGCLDGAAGVSWQEILAIVWREMCAQYAAGLTDSECPRCHGVTSIDCQTEPFVLESTASAMELLGKLSGAARSSVLVTGSILLVGEVLLATGWSWPST